MILESGEKVLYFNEKDWIEFSDWIAEAELRHGLEISAETAKPLLVEIAGLQAEIDILKKQKNRNKWLTYGLSVTAMGLLVIVSIHCYW